MGQGTVWEEQSGELFQFKVKGVSLEGRIDHFDKLIVKGKEVTRCWINAELGKVYILLTAQLEMVSRYKPGTEVRIVYEDEVELDADRRVKVFKVFTAKKV